MRRVVLERNVDGPDAVAGIGAAAQREHRRGKATFRIERRYAALSLRPPNIL